MNSVADVPSGTEPDVTAPAAPATRISLVLSGPDNSELNSAAFSPNGKEIVAASEGGTAHLERQQPPTARRAQRTRRRVACDQRS